MKKFLATLAVAGLCFLLYRVTGPTAPDTALAAVEPTATAGAEPAVLVAEAAPQATAALGESSSFTPLAPKTAIADETARWAQDEINRIFSNERSAPSSYTYEFTQANDLYKEEAYGEAKEAYAALLENCPVHPGARNNYALALMQEGDHEEALRQLVLLGCLTPDYEGLWVNLAVAGYPLGLYPQEIWAVVSPLDIGFPDFEDFLANYEGGGTQDWHDPLYAAYKYNEIYLAMERETPPEDDRTFDLLVQEMQKGNVVTKDDQERMGASVWYIAAGEDLSSIGNAHPGDPDVEALTTYLDALRALRFPVRQ